MEGNKIQFPTPETEVMLELDEETYKKIEKIAQMNGISPEEVISRAISAYRDQQNSLEELERKLSQLLSVF